jgi:hypothetical protein
MGITGSPPWLVFVGTTGLIVVAIESGYRLGSAVRRRYEGEKESPVSAITGSVLALLAFLLAFTFGIVSNRFDARKELVREQAITISTAYARTDFLPQPDRDNAKALFRTYMDALLETAEPGNGDRRAALIAQLSDIVEQLWDMGVAHAQRDTHSEVAALYIDALNSVGDVQALRVAVALQAKIPSGIWAALFALMSLAMVAVGYQAAIAKSRRTWLMLLLALSFSAVVTLIAVLDDPESGYLPVSQQPLIDVQTSMQSDPTP